MYSYEDRIRAVELYVKLGNRVKATIRQLGYPTKNALKGWHRKYEQRLDLPVGYAVRVPKYSHAQKEAAVAHYLAHDRCVAATMRALGYPGRGTLTAWVREALPEARRAVVGSVGRQRYSGELMQAGVMALCTREESAQAVADKLGVCRPTLYNWKNQLLGREAPASMKHTNQSPRAQERDELEREVEALRRAVRQLRLEQDLLNKANELLKNGHRTRRTAPLKRNTCRPKLRTVRLAVADSFLEASNPVKKPGPGEAADPAVVAPSCDPV